MMKLKGKSIHKFEPDVLNEDACFAKGNLMAVSDGAGGGGVFAERWSHYLVNNLPEKPITDYSVFNDWINDIWESFYNEQEIDAKKIGGLFLNKFYDEGSFATLAAVWQENNIVDWITYGDSVVFHYNRVSGILKHSFTCLEDFALQPFLINWKDPCEEKGFHSGQYQIDKDSVVLITSDTLAAYILMMYQYCQNSNNQSELHSVANGYTKLSNIVKGLLQAAPTLDFGKDVINPLTRSVCYSYFENYLRKLYNSHLLGHDDYSLTVCSDVLFKQYKNKKENISGNQK